MRTWISVLLLASLVSVALTAEPEEKLSKKNPAHSGQEKTYYKLVEFPVPEHIVLEAGGLEWMPNGELAISTRRGDIYLLDKPFATDPDDANLRKYAGGLHEVLGLAYRDDWLYATQRCEVTRMKDTDKDGRADVFETVSDGWEINGDYHEYAFGSKFDKNGDIWVVLCLTGSFGSDCKYRGWCLRIGADGKVTPTCSGIRSPGGIGMNGAGDVFYTDNQGPWNGACSLKWLKPGTFQGHPGGNKWYEATSGAIGPRPKDPLDKSRMMVEAKKIPELMPPAVYFPYSKMGKSAAGIVCDASGGKFGPFGGQLFVSDQSDSTLMRVSLEMIDGKYQGACYPFRQGFGSGALSVIQGPDGSLFVGGTNRGWGSRGPKNVSLDRLVWTGETPFEILEMKAKPDGFTLSFTDPIDPATAGKIESYKLETYTYIYQGAYGSPEVDQTKPMITKVEVADDKKSVRLFVDKLQEGHVHELHLPGVTNADGLKLLHPQAYYTLNYIPQ